MTRPTLLHTLLLAALGLPFAAAHAQSHDHADHATHDHAQHADHTDHADHAKHTDHAHHAEHADAAMQLDDGKRWSTDAPLREGMERIRNAYEAASSPGAGHAEAVALAPAINDAIGYMVQNCALQPKADATLHVLLGQLGTAAATLGKNPHADTALADVKAALEQYPQYFEHPGWIAGHVH
jgi:hypothetical protein